MRYIFILIISSFFLPACSNSTPEAKNQPKKPVVYKEVEPSQAYGSGYRKESGQFTNMDKYASFWSKDTLNAFSANAFHLDKKRFTPLYGSYYRTGGFSVRCLKN
jgi:uncharacterized protein (TIGR02145 family)